MKTKKWLAVGGPMLCLSGLATFQVVRNSGNPLEDAAREYVDCFNRRNAGCMMKYVSSAEYPDMGLSEESLQEFLDKYLNPKLEGFEPEGPVQISADSHRYNTEAMRTYRHKDGRTFTLYQRWWHIGDETATDIASSLWNVAVTLDPSYPKKLSDPKGWRKEYAQNLKKELPLLNSLKLRGTVNFGGIAQKPPAKGLEGVWETFFPRNQGGPKAYYITKKETWAYKAYYMGIDRMKASAESRKWLNEEVVPVGLKPFPPAPGAKQRMGFLPKR